MSQSESVEPCLHQLALSSFCVPAATWVSSFCVPAVTWVSSFCVPAATWVSSARWRPVVIAVLTQAASPGTAKAAVKGVSCVAVYCTAEVLYGCVPYRTVPYRTVLYCTVPYCTVLYCTVKGVSCVAVYCWRRPEPFGARRVALILMQRPECVRFG